MKCTYGRASSGATAQRAAANRQHVLSCRVTGRQAAFEAPAPSTLHCRHVAQSKQQSQAKLRLARMPHHDGQRLPRVRLQPRLDDGCHQRSARRCIQPLAVVQKPLVLRLADRLRRQLPKKAGKRRLCHGAEAHVQRCDLCTLRQRAGGAGRRRRACNAMLRTVRHVGQPCPVGSVHYPP